MRYAIQTQCTLCFVVLLGVFTAGLAIVQAGPQSVTIVNFAYTPVDVTVQVGESVEWTNADSSAHTATSTTGAWDTGTITKQQSKSIVFSTPGTFTYTCTFHPSMSGTVTVVAAGQISRVHIPLALNG